MNAIFLPHEQATLDFANVFSGCLKKFRLPENGLTVYLDGDLGAGKTTFVRGLLHALGFVGNVKSPTYSLLEEYHLPCDLTVQHFDLYRFSSPEEWTDAGFDDLDKNAIRLIEWADKGAGFAPPADLTLALTVQNLGRMVTITALSDLGKDFLKEWQN